MTSILAATRDAEWSTWAHFRACGWCACHPTNEENFRFKLLKFVQNYVHCGSVSQRGMKSRQWDGDWREETWCWDDVSLSCIFLRAKVSIVFGSLIFTDKCSRCKGRPYKGERIEIQILRFWGGWVCLFVCWFCPFFFFFPHLMPLKVKL